MTSNGVPTELPTLLMMNASPRNHSAVNSQSTHVLKTEYQSALLEIAATSSTQDAQLTMLASLKTNAALLTQISTFASVMFITKSMLALTTKVQLMITPLLVA